MRRLLSLLALVGAAIAPGCTCGRTSAVTDRDGGGGSAAVATSRATDAASGAMFSAPIAGAQIGGGAVIVAGLVVVGSKITAVRLEPDGRTAWTKTLFEGVTWAPDVDLKAFPVAGGAVVVWRGPRGGRVMRQLVALGGDGKVLDGPITIGAAACATNDGAAWSEAAGDGQSRVRMRTELGGTPHEEVGPVIAADFSMICGAHQAYAISEGDDESPPRVFRIPSPGAGPLLALGAETFGRDEERDLLPYVDGDDLGLVRVSSMGVVQVAEIKQGKAVVLRREKNRIPVDDDIVAVDANAQSVFVVYTHDESERCKDNRGGASVHALRIARQGEGDARLVLAPGECGKDAGPFWTGSPTAAGGALTVAWAERTPRQTPVTPPIAGLAYRVLEAPPDAPVVHIASPADALVDAGCDAKRCYALALVRESGDDGMSPESVRVLSYP